MSGGWLASNAVDAGVLGHKVPPVQQQRRVSTMNSQRIGLVAIQLFLYIYNGDCLVCYSCPSSSASDAVSANLNCLANSTELTCSGSQDRCYSLTSEYADVKVEKGCTSSERCLGNRICCSQDFCNAGQGSNLQTGVGKTCNDVTDCVQGADDITCSPRSQRDMTRVCLCRETRYTIGAICRSMSRVGGPCHKDEHCLPYNSFCEYNACRCGHYFFANDTVCSLKVALLAPCSEDKQCRPEYSECMGGLCTCKPGYDTNQETGVCSGHSNKMSFLLFLICVTVWWLQDD